MAMRFGTAVICIDGRVQMPVIRYMRNRFALDYVDIISEPGPNRLLAAAHDRHLFQSVVAKIRVSIDRHGSHIVAVVGHYDCAGNPVEQAVQTEQTKAALALLRPMFSEDVRLVGFWVNQRWNVIEVA